MTFRYAAALTLVGWYLMVPPPMPFKKGQPDRNSNAPLSTWDIEASFDTAAECQARLDDLANEGTAASIRTLNETHDQQQATLVYENWTDGRCISTDDPRLKGN